jgi:thymidylate synthase (FAD)
MDEKSVTKINVLDKGYVRLVDSMGGDISIVNAARVSYDKESTEFDEKDERLLAFLLREKHFSPLRHAALTFEIYTPLIVARQWWKHAVASTYVDDQLGWNESSRRYITEDEQFYIPGDHDWRSKPENSKQGSGENLPGTWGGEWTEALEEYVSRGVALYEQAMDAGIAPEQARLFLPAYGLYVRSRWTTSLAATIHFLSQRLDSHAQAEIREYARAVYDLTYEKFPVTLTAAKEAGLL